MKIAAVLLILFGLVISGCITNPTEDVPVGKVNITFVEEGGRVVAANYTLTQGTVAYINRPRHTRAESLPTIGAMTMIVRGKNSTIGPWEAVPFKGNGTYSFNVGFPDNMYPVPNDTVRVIIIVAKGREPLFDGAYNIKWK